MKNLKNIKLPFSRNTKIGYFSVWLALSMLACFFTSCEELDQSIVPGELSASEVENKKNAPAAFPAHGNLVEVKTEHMNFILPDEIPSGWTTFRYHNKSHFTHFMLIDKLPFFEGEQKTIESFKEISPVFIDAMDHINEGRVEEGFAEFSRLPAWFSKIVFSGGVGLVSPGNTTQTTVYMKPGVYVLECYVKTGGKFHPMQKQLIVSEKTSKGKAPKPTLEMTISKENGIEMNEDVRPGLHTVAVHFKDQDPHEHFLGHDVHLVKLEENTDVDVLNNWMNWVDPNGLNTPAPANFIGGVQEMPADNTAYMTVLLKPGRYAWVSEVPNPASKQMLKTFTVPGSKSN